MPKCRQYLAKQARFYTGLFYPAIVLIQVGCYYECYNRSAEALSKLLGYRLREKWRGLKVACGFHQRYLDKVCLQLETRRVSYAIVKQTERLAGYSKERVPHLLVQFL